ncbi:MULTISPECIES: hypothetical protein [Pseudomonas]|uniref:hypothetical protein n=1 Tax=Pseudomonas TaxID=286 RepID=UPI000FAC99EB|nr:MULTISPECIES: hypothetical protein [Pseudomonas]QNV67655.1 hypothetical protein F7661_18610 [Pseudomonas sp. CFA]MCX2817558.1 hypothetical protein [Pseudomonas sp. DCB_E]MCX9145325.1 hypothetical protein [Pseudomonas sp. DCB_Q]MDD2007466.1 hypothetical protein [Pseudomonas putida]MDH0709972.1 hypothetical protein [Pseudomonas sp. GD03862]
MGRAKADIFFEQLQFLEGDADCLTVLLPILNQLAADLVEAPCSQYGMAMLPLFRRCMLGINALALPIETAERDSLLDVLYRLGELVGISRESFYLEAWRGDW